jgi:hypothetical protein
MCMNSSPKAFEFCLSFILPSKKAYVDLWVGMKVGILASNNIAKSKTRPYGDASHTLWSRCASVWNIFF